MFSRKSYHTKTRLSLISSGWVNPQGRLKAQQQTVLQQLAKCFRVPASEIVDVRFLEHKCVVIRRVNGKKCSQFFSYRQLPIWQDLVIEAINSCRTLETVEWLGERIAYDLQRFEYPPATKYEIWEFWQERMLDFKSEPRKLQLQYC